MKTANLPYTIGKEQKSVDDYGRSLIDGKKTKYREALERIARSDLMRNPIPISELDKYKTHELELYTVENEHKETIEQVELISKETEFAEKVRTDISNCNTVNDFIRLLHKYEQLHENKAFKADIINRADQTVIKQSETENDLIDIWNIFKCLAVKDDPDDLLIAKIKQRRTQINKNL